MNTVAIEIEGEKVVLDEVTKNGDNKLYRLKSDWRITGAPIREIREKFPDYKFEPFERLDYDFLIEEDGNLKLYEPDGSDWDPEFED